MIRGQARELLLTSARSLCARDGVGATSIRGVIDGAGTNLNAVHYHFGSREALIDAVAEDAMKLLNGARFANFDRTEKDLRPSTPKRTAVHSILDAGYGPLFLQALGPERAHTREGLLVLGQLRNDPLAAQLPVMNTHSDRFVKRIESLLKRHIACSPARLRRGMQLVNSAAWDSALRPDVLARIEDAASPKPQLRRLTREFLDFAVAGLLALTSGPTR